MLPQPVAPSCRAQRACKKWRVRTLHARATHRRKNLLHELSPEKARESAAVFVGGGNALALAKALPVAGPLL